MDALRQPLRRLRGEVNALHFAVHLNEVVVDELVDDLSRQIDPNVEDAALSFLFEGVLEVFLDIGNDDVGATEI